jgi:alanyl-tRNA synthetase
MTSAEIRQSFLDFFKSKQHTIVPSSSLLPDAPNLLFTNAGMNQFVPVFLGQKAPDVSKWAGAVPGLDTRAADTQKCIRAGGKHNDLEDVGLDTYHHTFFEMLGNWSFGDYFKREAIEWAWELITEVWRFPKHRLYATVYRPGPGDPAEFDQEAYEHWVRMFSSAGLDPARHICSGGKKDNFWMMGETGPCGPCSEIHVDLTQQGDTRGALVNQGSSECIEIWNLVFIQFNAGADGAFTPLPARHVDTGMGFERVASIMQCTKDFTDFGGTISNYETDIFRPIFAKLEVLSGKEYGSTLPVEGGRGAGEQERIDIAFRVIADHIRTLGFAIADGIQPGNKDRNYVLRRILRRAVRYGRALGFHEPFFYRLVDVLAETMGHVFPEIREKQAHIQNVIRTEEEAFNRTLDEGIGIFEEMVWLKNRSLQFRKEVLQRFPLLEELEANPNRALEEAVTAALGSSAEQLLREMEHLDRQLLSQVFERTDIRQLVQAARDFVEVLKKQAGPAANALAQPQVQACAEAFRARFVDFLIMARQFDGKLNGSAVFLLYDTYGFPVDLTELMAREQGWSLDLEGYEQLMAEQRQRSQAKEKQVIELAETGSTTPTRFVGYDQLETPARVLEVVKLREQTTVVLDTSACYAEMGGQVGDIGEIRAGSLLWRVVDTKKSGETWLHLLPGSDAPERGVAVTLAVDKPRRESIQRHHTVTHLLHWALHEVVSPNAGQQGSFVGPEKLTFDFNHAPLSPQQVADVERLVNERILENAPVSWTEVPYAAVHNRKDVMQFFGDKYGDQVRVVQIGGRPAQLDGYSMELCGGTHTQATGQIGLFRIVSENAIAAGIRRIEAVAGLTAYAAARQDLELIKSLSGKVNSPVAELQRKVESLLLQQKELEKALRAARQKEATQAAHALLPKARPLGPVQAIIENLGPVDGGYLQSVADALKDRFQGVLVLGGIGQQTVSLLATVSPSLTKQFQAGKIIQAIAPIVGGKGGGRPDNARGGGKDVSRLDEALAQAASLLTSA